MELREYGKIIRKRLWLIVLLMVLGGVGAASYTYQRPPEYRSTTTLFLNPAAASALMNYQPYDALQALSRTYTEFVRTRSFAHHLAQELNPAIAESKITASLSTEYVVDTQFFRISATYSDPASAQALANAAAKVLIAENIARQQAEQEQIEAQRNPNPERQRLSELRTAQQNELDLYTQQLKSVQSDIDQLRNEPQSSDKDKRLLALQEKLVNMQSLRITTLNGLADTQAALANTDTTPPNVNTAVVVDAATLPTNPLPNKIVEYTLLALMVMLTIGAGIAFLLEYIDYTVKTPESLDAVYGIPAQGVIGVAPTKRGQAHSGSQLVSFSDPHSSSAEAFRALRTSVQVAGMVSPMRSLLITSAGPGEGKTFVSTNLAISLAQNGSRVILVDTDLRKPRLHYVFNLPLAPGFTNLVLNQQQCIEDLLQPTGVENLRVLTCGVVPPNPAELLGSAQAAQIMQQLGLYADIVIYDSPPAATVTDAVVIAPRMDAVLQVVRAGSTRIDLMRRCLTLLERGGARILGPVLNQVSTPDLGSYSYYYAADGYHNGNGHSGNGHSGNGSKPAKRSMFGRLALRREPPKPTVSNGVTVDSH